MSGAAGNATDLFDAATIDRLIRHFERVLAGMAERPEPPPITRSTARSMPG